MRSSAGPDLEQQARWSFMLDESKQAQSLSGAAGVLELYAGQYQASAGPKQALQLAKARNISCTLVNSAFSLLTPISILCSPGIINFWLTKPLYPVAAILWRTPRPRLQCHVTRWDWLILERHRWSWRAQGTSRNQVCHCNAM